MRLDDPIQAYLECLASARNRPVPGDGGRADKADRSPGEGQPGPGVRAIHQRRRTTAAGVQPQVLLQRTRGPGQPAVVDRVEASLTGAPAHAVVPRAPGLAPASAYAPTAVFSVVDPRSMMGA